MLATYRVALGLLVLLLLAASSSTLAQEQKLIASDGRIGDHFGHSLALSGNYAIITARDDDDNGTESGSAYVFERIGGTWVEQQKLTASDGQAGELFGVSVSLSGNLAIIGAFYGLHNGADTGTAYIFERTGGTWVEQQKLTASDGQARDAFGVSVALSGNLAIVGAHSNDDIGAAYVFERIDGTWVEQQKLTASDGQLFDVFGASVALSGNLAIVGAFGDDDIGSAYVFERIGGTWVEQQKLFPAAGQSLDVFGHSISISGDNALIGSLRDDDKGMDSGSVYVFKRTDGTWVEQQKLTASDGRANDEFGVSISLSGTLAIVGAYRDENNGINTGSAYLFRRVGSIWEEQQKLLASDGDGGDAFGFSASLSGETVMVGAWQDDDNGNASGSVYAYPVPSFSITQKKLTRSANGTKKVKIKWNAALVNKGKLDFYVDEAPDGSYLKRTANDGNMKLKLPTGQFPGDGPFMIQACEKNSTAVCSNTIIADFTGVPIDLSEPETDEEDNHASKASIGVPEVLKLDGSYPNPFNPIATIRYALPEASHVTLRVYDVLGREIETLVNAQQEAGRHEAEFEASHLPSGVYVYRLEAQGKVKAGHMLLLK